MKKPERPHRSVRKIDEYVIDYACEDACMKVANVKSVKKCLPGRHPQAQEHPVCADLLYRSGEATTNIIMEPLGLRPGLVEYTIVVLPLLPLPMVPRSPDAVCVIMLQFTTFTSWTNDWCTHVSVGGECLMKPHCGLFQLSPASHDRFS